MALRDSSDFRQALDLMRALAGPSGAAPVIATKRSEPPALRAVPPVRGGSPPIPPPPPAAMPRPPGPPPPPMGPVRFIGDEMSDILRGMCRRGGFAGAVVADAGGLPVADFNCPVDPEAVAACSSVLGDAMRQAGRLLRQRETNNISMDINYVDKVALRRFEIEGAPYFLMVICPQAVDERSEIEVSIERIIEVLGRGGRLGAGGPLNQRIGKS